MSTVNARELARNTSSILDEVEQTRRPALVVRNGHPVAALVPIDAEELEDYILATAPVFLASMEEADAALVAGTVREIGDVFADSDDESS